MTAIGDIGPLRDGTVKSHAVRALLACGLLALAPAKARAGQDASLTILSTPSNAAVFLDGHPAGRTPLLLDNLSAAEHEVVIDDPCLLERASKKVVLRPGKGRILEFTLRPRQATLDLRAVDESGHPVASSALVDDVFVGPLPGSYPVPACAKVLRIETFELSTNQALALHEGELAPFVARLPVERCDGTHFRRDFAGWTALVATVAGGGAMIGALALQGAVTSAPAGDSGVASKRTMGRALNLGGLAGLAIGLGAGGALLALPRISQACVWQAQ